MDSQSFTPQELCGICTLALRHDASEIEVTDCRPDAQCLVVKVYPSEHTYCLNDEGREIDAPASERDGLPVLVFTHNPPHPTGYRGVRRGDRC